MLEQSEIDNVYRCDIKPFLTSFTYEKLCHAVLKKHIQNTTQKRYKHVGRWWLKDAEIDIIAISNSDIAFAECKWQNKNIGLDVYNALHQKW